MNNKKIAEEISNEFTSYMLWPKNIKRLSGLIKSALDKVSGKPEHELKSGDHVLVSNSLDNPVLKAIFLYKDQGKIFVHIGGHLYTDTVDNVIPDPAYERTLQFIEHDDGNACPISEYDEIIYLHNDGHFSWHDNAKHVPWKNIKLYAVVPKGWLK